MGACEKCQVIIAMLGFSSDMTRAVLMSQWLYSMIDANQLRQVHQSGLRLN